MTTITPSIITASVTTWWHCRDCEAAAICCPGCGELLRTTRPPNHPPDLPFLSAILCPGEQCNAAVAVTVIGFRPTLPRLSSHLPEEVC